MDVHLCGRSGSLSIKLVSLGLIIHTRCVGFSSLQSNTLPEINNQLSLKIYRQHSLTYQPGEKFHNNKNNITRWFQFVKQRVSGKIAKSQRLSDAVTIKTLAKRKKKNFHNARNISLDLPRRSVKGSRQRYQLFFLLDAIGKKRRLYFCFHFTHFLVVAVCWCADCKRTQRCGSPWRRCACTMIAFLKHELSLK